MVGSTLVPPALATISCLNAAIEMTPPGDPKVLMKATRGDVFPRAAVSTSFTTASKRDSMALKTLFASGSLLKKGAANFIHSARPSKPEKCGGDV